MLGCFNPYLGQIWTNPAIFIIFLTLSLSIGLKQLSILLVY